MISILRFIAGLIFGGLVNLMMLDTRIIARDEQLDYGKYITANGLDIAKFQADLTNPMRTLMGETQREWLLGSKEKNIVGVLQSSTATWNVVGQQVLMSKMWIPAELLASLGQITSGGTSPDTLAKNECANYRISHIKITIRAG